MSEIFSNANESSNGKQLLGITEQPIQIIIVIISNTNLYKFLSGNRDSTKRINLCYKSRMILTLFWTAKVSKSLTQFLITFFQFNPEFQSGIRENFC